MELEGSLPYPQEPVMSSYSKPNESNPNPTTCQGEYEANIIQGILEKQGTEM
jgi:hypothetical protein